MTLWEYLTAPTLTHAASKSSISAQVRPTGGRQNCVIPPTSSATPISSGGPAGLSRGVGGARR